MRALKKNIFFRCLTFFFACNTSEKKQINSLFKAKNIGGYTISGISYAKADSVYLLVGSNLKNTLRSHSVNKKIRILELLKKNNKNEKICFDYSFNNYNNILHLGNIKPN